jgi:hypothetical protein
VGERAAAVRARADVKNRSVQDVLGSGRGHERRASAGRALASGARCWGGSWQDEMESLASGGGWQAGLRRSLASSRESVVVEEVRHRSSGPS